MFTPSLCDLNLFTILLQVLKDVFYSVEREREKQLSHVSIHPTGQNSLSWSREQGRSLEAGHSAAARPTQVSRESGLELSSRDLNPAANMGSWHLRRCLNLLLHVGFVCWGLVQQLDPSRCSTFILLNIDVYELPFSGRVPPWAAQSLESQGSL